MRRQGGGGGGGHYGGDSGGGGGHHSYGGGGGGGGGGSAQVHQNSKSGGYYSGDKDAGQHNNNNNQWRWERDDAPQAKLPQAAMSPTAPFAEGQDREAQRSYYQNQRMDPRIPMERQGGGDPRSQPQEEDMDVGYEDNPVQQTFEGLEQRFLDDIMRLSKDQTNAEDAENARHRERINTINAQYEEQLLALRARHAGRREEFLRRESQARKQQYQQIVMEQYPPSGSIGPTESRGFNASEGDPHRGYSSESYDTYNRERGRFPSNARDHGYNDQPNKVLYPRGRAYGGGSRYY